MNAPKFANYLRDYSVERGVTDVLANVVKTNVRENGHISLVETDIEKTLEADLFVDYTGFLRISWRRPSAYNLRTVQSFSSVTAPL